MLRALLLIIVAVMLLELAVFVGLVRAIGWSTTLVIAVVSTLVGGFIARHQHQRGWRNWQAARASGKLPAENTLEPLLLLVSGVLLLVPGFVTDVLGLLLLVPIVRRGAARLLWPRLQQRFAAILQTFGAGSPSMAPRRPYDASVLDTEGEAVPGSDEPPSRPQLR